MSEHERTRALVLRTTNFAETGRYVTLLSAEHGVIEASARNARGRRSRLVTTTEAFSLADFQLFHYKDRYSINSADFVYAFTAMKQDLAALSCASQLSELTRDLCTSAEEAPAFYELMVRACYAMELEAVKGLSDPEPLLMLCHAGEARLLALSGYSPDLDHCAVCGNDLEGDAIFDFRQMGLLHMDCAVSAARLDTAARRNPASAFDRMTLSAGTVEALRWFALSPPDKLFSFRAGTLVLSELNALMPQLFSWHLDKQYHNLDLIDQLLNPPSIRLADPDAGETGSP